MSSRNILEAPAGMRRVTSAMSGTSAKSAMGTVSSITRAISRLAEPDRENHFAALNVRAGCNQSASHFDATAEYRDGKSAGEIGFDVADTDFAGVRVQTGVGIGALCHEARDRASISTRGGENQLTGGIDLGPSSLRPDRKKYQQRAK